MPQRPLRSPLRRHHAPLNFTTVSPLSQTDPVVDGVLIADMSSNYLSKPVDVSKYGVRPVAVFRRFLPPPARLRRRPQTYTPLEPQLHPDITR